MIIGIFSNVQAAYFNEIGLTIEIPEEYINLTDHINANQEIWEKYNVDITQIKEYYKKNGVVLDAINEDNSKSLLILTLTNTITKNLKNLNMLSEEKLQQFLNQYVQEKQKQKEEVQEKEIYQKDNVVYLHCLIKQTKQEGNIVQVDEYYTIVNGAAISISLNYLTGEIQQEELKNIINTVEIPTFEVKNENISIISIILLVLLIVSTYGVGIYREKKGNIVIGEKEKKTLIQKAIFNYGIREYEKFGGYLKFFFVTIVLSLIAMVIQIILFLINGNVFGELNWQRTYNLLLFVQLISEILGLGYIICNILKKEAKNVNKIKKTILIVLAITVLITILRIVISYLVYHIPTSTTQYYQTELNSLVRNIFYFGLWYFYYRNSMRVQVYYKEKTLEQVIENPTSKIQQRKANRMLSEAKIRDYLEKNKAIDKKSAVLLNSVPEIYRRSAFYIGLVNKKIIKFTMGKAYLNGKRAKDETFEKKRQARLIGGILIVYVLAVLLAITI